MVSWPASPQPWGESGTTGFITVIDPHEVRVDVTVDETDVADRCREDRQHTFDVFTRPRVPRQVIRWRPTERFRRRGQLPAPQHTRNQALPGGLTARPTSDRRKERRLVGRCELRCATASRLSTSSAPKATCQRPSRRVCRTSRSSKSDGLQEGETRSAPAHRHACRTPRRRESSLAAGSQAKSGRASSPPG